MTPEQEKLRADLVASYGLPLVEQARHLSGLKLCLQALALDELSAEEREKSYASAGMHLAQLIEMLMTPERSAQLTECAARLDSAIDLWMADEMEKRDGIVVGGDAFMEEMRRQWALLKRVP